MFRLPSDRTGGRFVACLLLHSGARAVLPFVAEINPRRNLGIVDIVGGMFRLRHPA
jgi:hypothetical protein